MERGWQVLDWWFSGSTKKKEKESSVEVSLVGNLVKKKWGRKGSLSCVLVTGLSKRKRGCLFFILAKGGKGGGFECFCSLRERSRALGYRVGLSQFRTRARKQREFSLGFRFAQLVLRKKERKIGSAKGLDGPFSFYFYMCISWMLHC